MKIGIFPGTFDPPTLGHLNILQKAKRICDHLIVAIAIKPDKAPLFSPEERKKMLEKIAPGVEIISFHGLIVDLAKKKKASFLIRGLRTFADFEYEFQMAQANLRIGKLETIFLIGDDCAINSSLIRELAYFNGPISHFVPKEIEPLIRKKFSSKGKKR